MKQQESELDRLIREMLQNNTDNPKLKNLKPVNEMTREETLAEIVILIDEINDVIKKYVENGGK